MLIYDRRRCRPPQAAEVRGRLTLPQRARLGQLEREGWQMLFVRGEPAAAFLTHGEQGHGMLGRDGRLISVRALPQRQEGPAEPALAGDEAAIDAADEIAADTAGA